MANQWLLLVPGRGFIGAMGIRAWCSSSDQLLSTKSSIKLKTKSSAPRIYTRTGDKGKSSLYTGERRSKSDTVFDALGCTDELSSHLGLALEYAAEKSHDYVPLLQRIQCILQDVSTCIATPRSSAMDAHSKQSAFAPELTVELEEWIDSYSKQLAPLRNFILPGGGKTSAALHVARAVCRRAERKAVPLVDSGHLEPEALKYLNRLSDFLFTVARFAAKIDGKEETIYISQKANKLKSSYAEAPKTGIWKRRQVANEKPLDPAMCLPA